MQDFMTPERRERLLGKWEESVRDRPLMAFDAGPPSWLVREDWNEKKEDFTTAANRVRDRYFSGGRDVARALDLRANVKTEEGKRLLREGGWDTDVLFGVTKSVTSEESVTGVTLCPVCEEVPLVGRQTVCSVRCRKRRQRGA